MKGLCKSALAALVLAACGGDGAITEPSTPNAAPSGGGILAIGVDSLTGASIETNKDDYSPGEIVHVVGKGWAPGETVNLHMTEEPDTHADVDTNVVADDAGGFSIHYYDVQTHDLGVTFTLTATGGTSGSVAVATFTDAINLKVTGTDGSEHSTAAAEEDLGSIALGTALTVSCPTGLTLKAPGAGNDDFVWTLAVGGSGANNGVLSPLTTLTPSTGTLEGSGDTECVSVSIATGTLTVGTTYHGSLQMTGTDANPTPYFFEFTVIAGTVSTTTVLSAAPVSPTVFGQSVTFTATVTPASGPAAQGTVSFYKKSASGETCSALGSATLLGSDGTHADGFTLVTSALAVATHEILACYAPNVGWSSSSGSASHTVDKANTTTTIDSDNPDPSSVGETVAFVVSVAAVAPGTGTPAGTVDLYKFTDGQSCASPGVASVLGSGSLSSGSVTINVSSLAFGSHIITACYVGNSSFNGSSDTETHGVALVATTMDIASSVNPTVTGESTTFTATVTRTVGGAAVTTGTITFKTGGSDCSDAAATTIASASPDGSGQATHAAAFLASQSTVVVRACFTEGTTYAGSEDAVTQTINKAATTISPSDSPDPTVFGESVTLNASVSVSAPGSGTPTGPTGTVKFYILDSGASCTVPGSSLQLGTTQSLPSPVSTSTTAIPVGVQTVTACYSGDANFLGSVNTTEHTVNKAQTTLTLTTNTPKFFGQTSTFTAAISVNAPGAGTPTGSVNFAIGGTCQADGSISGGTSLGAGSTNVAISGGQAQFSTTTLNANTYNIVACFGGDGNFFGDGDNKSHLVNPAVTQTLASSSPDPSTFGQQVTFSATVSISGGQGAGTPTGTVTFRLGGTDCLTGLSLGNDPVDGTGVASINVTSASLDVTGSPHAIRACFDNTDGNYLDSNDADTHTVNAAASGTSIAVAPLSQQYSDKVVFTATITPASVLTSTQSGNVQFKVGGTNTGAAQAITCGATQCTATLTYTIGAQASPPTLAISAVFTSTNANFGNSASSTDAILTVTKEEATVLNEAVSPSNILVGQGGTLTFSVKETSPESNAGTLAAAGDLTKIAVADVVVTGKGILDPSKTISFSCSRTTGGTALDYTHTLNYTCTFGPVNAADTYEVDIDITGNYYDGAGATVIQVTDPNAGFTTGGGWYWYDQINYPGERVNFGFMAKATTNNKKTVFQGSLLVIRHKSDGSVVKIKSNVFEGYSIGSTVSDCTPATFTGKATYAVNGVSEGNFAFTGYGYDCGEPGTADKFSLYHAKSPNAVSTAASVGALATSAKTIVGGNVQVPQPSRR